MIPYYYMFSDEIRMGLVFILALFSAMFVIPRLANIASAIGLLDEPNGRKIHVIPRPLVGGIGIVIAATFSCLVFVHWDGFRGLFVGLALLLLIGFLDDFQELESSKKFLAQIGATILMIYFTKTHLRTFGDLVGLGDVVVPGPVFFGWCVTVFCVVGVINAVNMIDGLDGLAGGISLIAFLTFACHAWLGDQYVFLLINLALAGGVLGFLWFNWYPAKVFMGDAGSLSLGFALAYMSIMTTQPEQSVVSPVVPLLILAIPITDTIILMSKRILSQKSPFEADQYHLHHILTRFGFNQSVAVAIILFVSGVLSGITLIIHFYDIPDYLLFGIFLIFFFCYTTSSFFIVSTMRSSLRFKRRMLSNGERGK
jgi:UDP-GlcNAc:undecaprenyl-phosphate GlcNAc-1-phosphate transferase